MKLEELEQRLDLLKQGEMISDQSYKITKAAFTETMNVLKVDDIKHGEMLFTHLPMSLTRIEKGEEVGNPPSEVLEQIAQSSHYPLAKKLTAFIEELWTKSLPQGEKDFLYMHFANVLENNNGGVKR
ncbi:hypothetical protein GCM10011351_25860 [Paraliobacillus quinghaiensis]|uniref:PRD domain-containing protein n=1 Tax=Paraliobacillus quinghaiensis TaxID=470815 RepID=A0A917TUV0_9BACI|nr:PRD domain-containing protein [Paraliobacillus quinghaiensis]GGM38570.1 hypothetical protein GCM10011351_25860 [Paraliobacillus quinghaiensis]